MKFTTPCFVRVENPQERKELIEWMQSIGYPCHFEENSSYITTGTYYGDTSVWYEPKLAHYDCGTNIPLFKALSAMNDENYIEQWFIMNDELLPPETIFRSNIHPTLYRKATYEEIINHFKNQQL